MDYLDLKKEFRHHLTLMVGYVLVAVAITIATLVLLYQAYGFGLDKKGEVVQNGLTFFSSHPRPADIYVNGQRESVRTNSRLVLPAGIYDVKLTRDGYYDWKRVIEVNGGSVQHYDYPFLVPKTLTTASVKPYTAAPRLMTQSPDHRWLLIQLPGPMTEFHLYDLKGIDKEPTTLSLPATLLTKAVTGETWQFIEWADDNQHVMLQHDYDGKKEFILLDRAAPEQSVNLSTTLGVTPPKLSLINKKYDKYYAYDGAGGSLASLALNAPVPKPLLQHALAYKSYGDDTILYVTDNGAPTGKVLVKLTRGGKTWTIRSLSVGSSYVVDLTKYDGTMYVAAGSAGDGKVYVYKDPEAQLTDGQNPVAVATQVMRLDQVNYVSFSASAQFIMAESGNRFSVYDLENKQSYNYVSAAPLDAPQEHAGWMDGNRLAYISKGSLIVYDYDNLNRHTLMVSAGSYLPAFAPDYKYVYALAPNRTNGQFELTRTGLLIKSEL